MPTEQTQTETWQILKDRDLQKLRFRSPKWLHVQRPLEPIMNWTSQLDGCLMGTSDARCWRQALSGVVLSVSLARISQ